MSYFSNFFLKKMSPVFVFIIFLGAIFSFKNVTFASDPLVLDLPPEEDIDMSRGADMKLAPPPGIRILENTYSPFSPEQTVPGVNAFEIESEPFSQGPSQNVSPSGPPVKKRLVEGGKLSGIDSTQTFEAKKRKTFQKKPPKKLSPQEALQKKFQADPQSNSETFKKIMQYEPAIFLPDFIIDVENEKNGGSRRWVQDFRTLPSEDEQEVQGWHRKMNRAVAIIQGSKNAFYKKSSPKKACLTPSSNLLIARLRVISDQEGVTASDIPLQLFFASGGTGQHVFPGKKLNLLSEEMKTALSEKGLGADFTGYKIRTLMMEGNQMIDAAKVADTVKEEFKRELQQLFYREKPEGGILGTDRIDAHKRCFDDGWPFALSHYHSEQALRHVVHQKINRYKTENPDALPHVKCFVLDICSYYDMCWVCSDTLTRCGMVGHKSPEKNLVVRCSSIEEHFDKTPTIHSSSKEICSRKITPSLRSMRTGFLSYRTNKAWTLAGEEGGYQPYTAQALIESFRELDL